MRLVDAGHARARDVRVSEHERRLVREFCGLRAQFPSLLSVWMVHPLCPFSGRERFVVFICSVAFNFLWTACTTYNARRVERNVSDILKCKGVCFWWFYFISKHTVTVIYAVLIRQLVICPCLYEPVIRMACGDHTHGWRQESTKDLLSRARKLRRWKVRGDRVILALLVTHLVVIVLMIIIITTENWRHLDEYSSLDEIFLNRIFGSEVVNFFIWFPKFLPLFLFLFPDPSGDVVPGRDGSDYLKCKRSVFSYTRSYNYLRRGLPALRATRDVRAAAEPALPVADDGFVEFSAGRDVRAGHDVVRARQDAAHGAARVLAAVGRRRRRTRRWRIRAIARIPTANCPASRKTRHAVTRRWRRLNSPVTLITSIFYSSYAWPKSNRVLQQLRKRCVVARRRPRFVALSKMRGRKGKRRSPITKLGHFTTSTRTCLHRSPSRHCAHAPAT